jgi:glycosidase
MPAPLIARRWLCAAMLCLLLPAGQRLHAQAASENGGFVALECESFAANISPRSNCLWVAGNAVPGASGSGYMEALPNTGTTIDASWTASSPELQYTINFTNPGTYYVWVRAYAIVNTDAMFHAGVDGVSDTAARMVLNHLDAWSWTGSVLNSTTPAKITVATSGAHTFSLWMRDDGIRLDKIILTTNPNYSPEATADFWRNQNIYQILTDRFFNGDSSNDNATGNFNATSGTGVHGGDFKGLEQKLDYIKALGATAIWISPIVLNASGEYHGYAGLDFYSVDPHWGTLADLQHMAQEAHKRGILLVNDIVVNHGGNLIDSADTGYPNFKPSGYNMRFKSSSKQYPAPFDINASNPTIASLFHNYGAIQNYGDLAQVETGELSSLDDFRTESTHVRNAMADIYKYWVQEVGFDAFRIDTVKHVENGFWQSWCPALRQFAAANNKPNFFMFGEVYDGSDSKCGYYTGTKAGGVFEMDSVVDYPLYFRINSVFANATGNTQQIEDRYNAIASNYDAAARMQLVTFLDNHDQPRFMNTAGATTDRLNLALVFLYSARGIPCLYYGTEQAFDGGADPANREDMFDGQFEQGTSLGDNFNMTSAHFQLVAKLNNFRRLYPALRTGSHVNQWYTSTGPGLFAYTRRLGSQDVYVVLNTATSAQTIASRGTIYPPGTVVANLLDTTETYTVSATQEIPSLQMPATSAKIFVAQSAIQPLDPVVTSVSPAHDASAIGTASPIVIRFSKSMNTASVQEAFSTTPATTGTLAWSTTSSANDTLTYTPGGSGLAQSTLYTVRIASTAADAVSGNVFCAPFESRFTTGSGAVQSSKPSATTNAANNLAQTSATLNASVNPNGASTTAYFQYGRTSSYGTNTPTENLGGGNSTLATSANISGLRSGRTHHFRVVATNSNGTTYGADQTFVTPTTAPLTTATTNPATNVTISSATLNATVNPGGVATTVQFQYGVAPNQLTLITSSTAIGSGTSNVAVSANVTGLSANTTYYFLVNATNSNSTTPGSILSFATPPLTPSAATNAASSIGTTSATLNATINPNGSDTTAYFEYGVTAGYGSSTALLSLGSGASAMPASAGIVGLAFGTTYHFRVVAANPNGISQGTDQTFTTSYPPPDVTTDGATLVRDSIATINGTINPNGSASAGWFEYGPTASYGSSTRQQASDNAESQTAWNYNANSIGGSGLGAATYLEGTGGGLYLANSSTGNRQIDGANSFGVYAGSGGQGLCRSITAPGAAGTLTFSARFDVSNSAGFTGFNIKSAQGAAFAANELLSFGLTPSNGNTAIFVKGSTTQSINLDAELRGAVIDFKLDYNTGIGTYVLGAKLRASNSFATVSGNLTSTGQTATHLGFANFNNSGSNQNLIFDSLLLYTSASVGNGLGPVALSLPLTGLTHGATYHYRCVGYNSLGITYGPDMTFVPLTLLEQWRQTAFGTLDPNDTAGGDSADYDHDGVLNLLEFAFGMNPQIVDHLLAPAFEKTSVNGTDHLQVTFRRLRAPLAGVTYSVEESTDMVSWTPVDGVANLVSGPVNQLDGTEKVSVRGNISLSNSRAFLRVRVTSP